MQEYRRKRLQEIEIVSKLIALSTILVLIGYVNPTGTERLLHMILLVSIALGLLASPSMRLDI